MTSQHKVIGMRRFLFLGIIFIFGISFVPIHAQDSDIFTSPWRAEYFNNPYLAGNPSTTNFDSSIGFDWGFGAPNDNIPVDNFSARWGKGGNLATGTYRFIVTASYGFRLYINDEVILDTWDGGADGITIGRDIFIEGGNQNIQIDYRDFGGDAYIFLDWGLAPDGGVAPQSTQFASPNTVTVTANTLNVRSEARIANNIITRLTRGQQFMELNRSEDGRWVELDLGNGQSGWVSVAYVTQSVAASNTEGLTGQNLRSNTRLLVRRAPSLDSDAFALLSPNEDALVIGRSADGAWWQINSNGRIGWVNATYVTLSPDFDGEAVPITN